jgi:hypothetical protein
VTTALRVRAYGVGAVMVVLVAWPFTWAARHDSFPLSNYPMFSFPRQRVEALSSVVVQMPSGEIKRLSSQLISGGSETALSPVTVIAVNSGDGGTDELCPGARSGWRATDRRRRGAGHHRAVDVVDYLRVCAEERTVHARCAVPS